MKILSLFDGISCARVALERAGIPVEIYFASEIEQKPIEISQKNYPDIIQLGDVKNITKDMVGEIDLICGGSPCQSFSNAGYKKGFEGESGLFWEFARLVKEIKPKYFLLENVIMKQEWQDIISNELGVKPIEINSNLVSCQNRRRLYWTNIPNITQPNNKGILIKDIVFDDTYKIFTDERITKTKKKTKNYIKWDLSGKRYWSQQDRAYYKEGKICTLPKSNPSNKMNIVLDYEKDIYRRMHPIEAERCQNLPDDYTKIDKITANQRLEAIGNGWTVDVIVHILKNN